MLQLGWFDQRHRDYVDAEERATQREVRPLCLAFWGTVWTASAWCELREDFRTFRVDRMRAIRMTTGFASETGKDMAALQARLMQSPPPEPTGRRRRRRDDDEST